jgi:hypothetical protein
VLGYLSEQIQKVVVVADCPEFVALDWDRQLLKHKADRKRELYHQRQLMIAIRAFSSLNPFSFNFLIEL